MGLNLGCGNVEVRVGRYSTYHELKVAFVKMAINYINDNPELVDKLRQMIQGDKFDMLYLGKNSEIGDELADYGLAGLWVWLTHSDCSGAIDSMDAEYFYDFLLKTMRLSLEKPVEENGGIIINNFMPDEIVEYMVDLDDEQLVDKFYITPVFKESMRTDEDVIFC